MSFTYAGGATASGTTGPADTGAHGITINSGDLVTVYVGINGTGSLTPDDAGWNTVIDEIPAGETARHALYWRVAGASEPSNYSWTMGTSAEWRTIIKVFPGSNPTIDAAINSHIQTSAATKLLCGAYDGQIISDGAVAVIFGGKDNRFTAEAYTLADHSYVSVLGNRLDQYSAGAHRIYVTGETGSGDIQIDVADLNDNRDDFTYSCHMSFVEGSSSVVLELTAPVDFASAFDAVVTRQGTVSGQVDLTSVLSSLVTTQQPVSGQVDFADSHGALIVQLSDFSGQIDFDEAQTSILSAAAAIAAAADLGETWATIATQIADVTENVDLNDTVTGSLPTIQEAISGDVALTSAFAHDLIARASISGPLDLADVHSTVVQAIASIAEPVDFSDVQTALITAGMSFSEAVEFADAWVLTAGEIAAAVRIIVAARNRHIVAGARDRLIVVTARNRRITVNKLN